MNSTTPPPWTCEKCGQTAEDGVFHACPDQDIFIASAPIAPYKDTPYSVRFQEYSWKYTLLCALAFFVQPLAMPIMVVLSKILGKEIKFFEVEIK